MATTQQHALTAEDRILLTDISWEMYAADEAAWVRHFRTWVRERFPAS